MNIVVATAYQHNDYANWQTVLSAWAQGYEFITSYGSVFSIKDAIEMNKAGVLYIDVCRKSGEKLGTIDISDVSDIRYEKA